MKCQSCEKSFTKKWLLTHINVEQSLIECSRTFGPPFPEKVYLLLRKLEKKITKREIFMKTTSPQNFNEKFNFPSEDTRERSESEGNSVAFDNMLGSQGSQKTIQLSF